MGRRSRRLPTAQLVCRVCGSSDLYVTDSHGTQGHTSIVRRRKCAQCRANRKSTELPNVPTTDAEADEICRFAIEALVAWACRRAA